CSSLRLPLSYLDKLYSITVSLLVLQTPQSGVSFLEPETAKSSWRQQRLFLAPSFIELQCRARLPWGSIRTTCDLFQQSLLWLPCSFRDGGSVGSLPKRSRPPRPTRRIRRPVMLELKKDRKSVVKGKSVVTGGDSHV